AAQHDPAGVALKALEAGRNREAEAVAEVRAQAADARILGADAGDHRRRAVGGGVVDDDYLVVDSLSLEVGRDLPQGLLDRLGLVPGGDDDRQLHATRSQR